MVQPTGKRPNPTPKTKDHKAWSQGMPNIMTATRMADSAPAAPAFDASQRLGTSSQNKTSTGKPAKKVDQTGVHSSSYPRKDLPARGSSDCRYGVIAIGE